MQALTRVLSGVEHGQTRSMCLWASIFCVTLLAAITSVAVLVLKFLIM